jgi:hypothetical protein
MEPAIGIILVIIAIVEMIAISRMVIANTPRLHRETPSALGHLELARNRGGRRTA